MPDWDTLDRAKGKVVLCTPFLLRPTDAYLDSIEKSVKYLNEAGWRHGVVQEVGNCYISNARANCLRKAINGEPDVIIFIDYDLSWDPASLIKLIETPGDVIAGTYRYKKDEEEYMGRVDFDETGHTQVRFDGCLKMISVPAGFLKLTRKAVNLFMKAHPELIYGELSHPYVDLFSHGAIDRVWYGEDFAFAKRWRAIAGELWCLPDLNITHHHKDQDGKQHTFPGNYHGYLCRLPGGSHDPSRIKAQEALKTINLPALLASIIDEATGATDLSQQETPSL